MIHSIEIGGKERPVLFGNYAFRKMEKEAKMTMQGVLDDLFANRTTNLPVVALYALRAGETAKGLPADTYDVEQVALWLDMEPGATDKMFGWLIESVKDMSRETLKAIQAETPAPEGEPEKKGKAA